MPNATVWKFKKQDLLKNAIKNKILAKKSGKWAI